MSRKSKSRQDDGFSQIENGLTGLFGALGDAITEMMARLEDGTSATVERSQTLDSTKGPIRVHAGVRLRAGGLAGGNGAQGAPRPVNPDRPKTTPGKDLTPGASRSIGYDILEDAQVWILTAEVPGVARKDISIDVEGETLLIRTSGARRYHADVPLQEPCDPAEIRPTLRNGILTLTIPRKAAP